MASDPPAAPVPPGAPDKRRGPRVSAPKVVVRIPSADRFRSHYLKDLSSGGLFLKADRVFAVGTELAIELWPPGEPAPLYLSSRVTRCVEAATAGPGQVPGMGVTFVGLAGDTAQRLRRLIDVHGEELAAGPPTRPAPVAARGSESAASQAFELEEARALNSKLQSGLASTKQELAAAKQDLDRLHEAAKNLELALATSQQELAAARREAAAARTAQQTIEADQAAVRRAAKQEADDRTELEREVGALRGQLNELRAELEIAQGVSAARRSKPGFAAGGQVSAEARPTEARRADDQIPFDDEVEALVVEDVLAGATVADAVVDLSLDAVLDSGPDESSDAASSDAASSDAASTDETGSDEPVFNRTGSEAATAHSAFPPGEALSGLAAEDEPLFGEAAPALAKLPPAPDQGRRRAGSTQSPADPPGGDVLDAFLNEGPAGRGSAAGFGRPPTGGMAGFVLKDSIADGRVGYVDFTGLLTAKSRLLPAEHLAARKPASSDEARVTELLAASPTYGTLVGQVASFMKEERLKQLIYELYARALLDLRAY